MSKLTLQSIFGFNPEVGVIPFEDVIVYAVGSTVIQLQLDSRQQSFKEMASEVTSIALCEDPLGDNAAAGSQNPLVGVGCKLTTNSTFADVRVFENLFQQGSNQKTTLWGPFQYHVNDIEQVGFTSDGTKFIVVEKNQSRTVVIWDLQRLRKGEVIRDKPSFVVAGIHSNIVGTSGRLVNGITAMPVVSDWKNIADFSTWKYVQKIGSNQGSRNQSTAGAAEHRYFHKVRVPGERPPLRFVIWGNQTAVRFYAIDRRQNNRLCSTKATFNCDQLNRTNTAVENHVVNSCVILSDGIHSLMGMQGGEIFFFEDAQAMRVFKQSHGPEESTYSVMSLLITSRMTSGASENRKFLKNNEVEIINLDGMKRSVPARNFSSVMIGLSNSEVYAVDEWSLFDDVSKELTIKGAAVGSAPMKQPSETRFGSSSAEAPALILADIAPFPSILRQGATFKRQRKKLQKETQIIDADRSPKKKVLDRMEKRSMKHRVVAKGTSQWQTWEDKKSATKMVKVNKVIDSSKQTNNKYVLCSQSHVFVVKDDEAAQLVLHQPGRDITDLCMVPRTNVLQRFGPEDIPYSYVTGSIDGLLFFNDRFPLRIPSYKNRPNQYPAVTSVCSTYNGVNQSGIPDAVQYIACGTSDARAHVYDLETLQSCFTQSMGTTPDLAVTCCAIQTRKHSDAGPTAVQRPEYVFACGGSDGIVYVWILRNNAWNPRIGSSIMGEDRIKSDSTVGSGRRLNKYTRAAINSQGSSKENTEDRGLTCKKLTASQTVPLQLRGHCGPLHSLAFNSDGRFLLTTGSDSRRICFETATGQRLPNLVLVRDLDFGNNMRDVSVSSAMAAPVDASKAGGSGMNFRPPSRKSTFLYKKEDPKPSLCKDYGRTSYSTCQAANSAPTPVSQKMNPSYGSDTVLQKKPTTTTAERVVSSRWSGTSIDVRMKGTTSYIECNDKVQKITAVKPSAALILSDTAVVVSSGQQNSLYCLQ